MLEVSLLAGTPGWNPGHDKGEFNDPVIASRARHRGDLLQRTAELERAIAETLHEDEDGRRLQDIPGIGPVHAATIRARLGDVRRLATVNEVIAYAGLEPRIRQSGAFVGQKKLSKQGPGALRHALYLEMLVAARYRPEWRERYQCLLERGRAKKEALTMPKAAVGRSTHASGRRSPAKTRRWRALLPRLPPAKGRT